MSKSVSVWVAIVLLLFLGFLFASAICFAYAPLWAYLGLPVIPGGSAVITIALVLACGWFAYRLFLHDGPIP